MWTILLVTYVQFNLAVYVNSTSIASVTPYGNEASCKSAAQNYVGPVVLATSPEGITPNYAWNDAMCIPVQAIYGSSLMSEAFQTK